MGKDSILIVEDNLLTAEYLSDQLCAKGYQVVQWAAESQAALRAATIHKPDLILMDIDLEGEIDGIETAAKINERFDIPVIYLTGIKDEHTFQKALYTRPIDYVNKPVDGDTLNRKIKLVLHNHRNPRPTLRKTTPTAPSLSVKGRDMYHNIKVADILWVSSDGAYANIVTSAKTYQISKNSRVFLDELEQVAPGHFVRLHRSYIINIHKVSAYNASQVCIYGHSLPIGKTFRKIAKQHLQPNTP